MPCLFKWRPSDLILRLCSGNNAEMEEEPAVELQSPAPRCELFIHGPFTVNGMDLIELEPAAETTLYGTLPDRYEPLLKVGGRYEILLAGGEIEQWTWGANRDHQGQGQPMPPGPKISLPAGPRFRFTTLSPHWWLRPQGQNQRRRTPLIEPSARVPGAPVLKITLMVDDATITGREWDIDLRLKTKVTYHGVLGEGSAGPIIFHAGAARNYESDVFLDRCRNGATWEPVIPGFVCDLGMYLADLPRGGPEDLAIALNSLPPSGENGVAYPTNLDGHPKLVVPASDVVELVYVDKD
ncbi:hypothetical protein BJX63DRAFT_1396 [Aspergillus granulosus]|uniref:Uncharacterized protein n=1 Tax=Aspergillus granulosus TaxID=176169 RepID=A0ABR4I580_9EURO